MRLGDGGIISLDKVARVQFSDSVSEINRDNGRRVAAVQSNVRGRDVGSFVQDLRAHLDHEVKVPDGYRVELEGQFKNLESATARLKVSEATGALSWHFGRFAIYPYFEMDEFFDLFTEANPRHLGFAQWGEVRLSGHLRT